MIAEIPLAINQISMGQCLLSMAGKAKGNNLQLLHKPVHPVIVLVVILIALVGVGSVLMFALQSNRKPSPQ